MEHCLHDYPPYAVKIWSLADHSLTKKPCYILQDYDPALVLTLLEFEYNKSCPSILLHVKDATIRQILILLLQEIKRDIVNRLA
jgi:flagellar motor switch protein FliG